METNTSKLGLNEPTKQNENMIRFEPQNETSSIIKVIGVGGGGSNAVAHMLREGIKGVDFIVCNTDIQALDSSNVPCKIQLGAKLTDGLGAGSIPDIGKKAAEESIEEVMKMLKEKTKMVFITAGMGGGTGTGAAPVIAEAARKNGILTVGIVTTPFNFEGKKRKQQAEEGIKELKKHVDTLIIICNEKLREIHGNLGLREAFAHADNVLTTAAKGIAEIITMNGYINVDFNDVKTIMTDGGTAIMGYASASGQDRAKQVIEKALNSPLLLDNKIKGASQVLIVVSSSTNHEITMDEVGEICDYVQDEAGSEANVILGAAYDENLGENINVVVIATGFEATQDLTVVPKKEVAIKEKEKEIIRHNLEETVEKKPEPVDDPFGIKLIVKESEPQLNSKEEVKSTEEKTPISTEPNLTNNVSTQPAASETKTIVGVSTETQLPNSNGKFATDIINQNNGNESQTQTQPGGPIVDVVISSSTPKKDESQTVANNDNETINRQKHKDRIEKLKNMSMNLKVSQVQNNTNIHKLEKEPAYLRKNYKLDSVTPSDESHISRYTLDGDPDNQLKQNNSFLHDNVD